ncbi:hypothetical protein KAJ27_05415 [bacterium]|nr:hypothetical protein [bacterium]
MIKIIFTLLITVAYFYNLYIRNILETYKIYGFISFIGIMFVITFLIARHFKKEFLETSPVGFFITGAIFFISFNSFDFLTFNFFKNYVVKLICVLLIGTFLEIAGYILFRKILKISIHQGYYFPGLGFGISIFIIIFISTVLAYAGLFHISSFVPVFLCLVGLVYCGIFISRGLWSVKRMKTVALDYLPFILIIIPYFLYMFSSLAAPPHRMDELLYHLPCAEAIIENNGFSVIENIPWSNFPGNHFLIFAISKSIIPFCGRTLYLLFPIFVLLMMLSVFPRKITSVFLVLSAWIITVSGCHAGSEWILIFFEILTFILFIRCCKKDKTPGAMWIMVGVFAGLALGTKYMAFLLIFFISIYLLFFRRDIKSLILVIVPAVMVSLHWYYKSYLFCGNPVYPLMSNYFPASSEYLDFAASIQDKYLNFNGVSGFFKRLFLPFYLMKYDFSSYFQDGLLGLMFFPTFLFLDYKKIKTERVYKLFFVFLLFYFLIWMFFMPQVLRFAFFPLLVLPFLPRMKGKFFDYAVLMTFLVGVFIMIYSSSNSNAYLDIYSSKAGGTLGFIKRKIPEYTAIKFLNERTDENNQVLCLFDSRLQYFKNRKYIHTDYNSEAGYRVRKAESEDIPDILREFKIKYIFINLRRAEKTFLVPWVVPTVLTDSRFLKIFSKQVLSSNGVLIYKLN